MNPEIDPITYVLLAIIVLVAAVLFLVALASRIYELSRELDLINLEIQRTTGEEQKHWKRRKRRLWLSLLPFF